MTDPTSPAVNPFTLLLLALVALVLFGWSTVLPGGGPVPLP
jgi:hypothetical protein